MDVRQNILIGVADVSRRKQPVVANAGVLEQRRVTIEGDVLIAGIRIGVGNEQREAGVAVGSAGTRGAGPGRDKELSKRILRRTVRWNLDCELMTVELGRLRAHNRDCERARRGTAVE